MNILAVTADPQAPGQSLASALLNEYLVGAQAAGATVERADLIQERFDPRMAQGDLALYRGTGPVPEDVRREQERIERADVLVLAFPVYWWSMPGTLKGWIDRVFTKGWAFGGKRSASKLSAKKIRLIATAGGDAGLYDRHGYRAAMATQIEHGIFEFSGVRDVRTHWFFDVEQGGAPARQRDLSVARQLGQALSADASLAAAA